MSNKKYYRRRPIIFTAERWFASDDPDTYPSCVQWDRQQSLYFILNVLGKRMYLNNGDYIIQDPNTQQFLSCDPETFSQLFEEANKPEVKTKKMGADTWNVLQNGIVIGYVLKVDGAYQCSNRKGNYITQKKTLQEARNYFGGHKNDAV